MKASYDAQDFDYATQDEEWDEPQFIGEHNGSSDRQCVRIFSDGDNDSEDQIDYLQERNDRERSIDSRIKDRIARCFR